MRRALVLALLISSAASATELSNYACGSRQIVPGEFKLAVMGKCGEPALTDQRVEPTESGAPITVDEWSYNFGPYLPIVLFRFENGRLRRIETGDYGF